MPPAGVPGSAFRRTDHHGDARGLAAHVVFGIATKPTVFPLRNMRRGAYGSGMDLVRIYQCLCDRTRLRILHVLTDGPLCVCHLQEILGESQVKVSKHLRYLKEHGMVEAERQANWMIYRLPRKQPRELTANLACLQDCVSEDATFARDAKRAGKLRPELAKHGPLCGC